jgi:hypothetical protein
MKMYVKKIIGLLIVAGTLVSCNLSSGTITDTVETPVVTSTAPDNLSTGIAINSNITAVFSLEMDPATITAASFTVYNGLTAVAGVVSYTDTTASFDPTDDLANNTSYTVTINQQAKSLDGKAMSAEKVWSFTTGASADTVAPILSSTFPADTENGVSTDSNITAVFSEVLNAATVTTTTFTLKNGSTPVDGAATYSDKTATFNPTINLARNTTYTATITTGVTDLAGNALASNISWVFTTSNDLAPVTLGTAGDFVILSKSGISTASTSTTPVITGDIGVSPIADIGLTGFGLTLNVAGTVATSALVSGNVYAASYAEPTPTKLTAAIGDMGTAITDALGRTLPNSTNLSAGLIGGLTLVPGLYTWTTDVSMASNVTLNGGANDVWILQLGDYNLSMASGISVTLSGGAQAKNIFWMANSVTIGTTAHLEGIVLSKTTISVGTGASVNGRLFSQTAVTLTSSTVTAPAL